MFLKHRTVSFALIPKINEEIDLHVSEGALIKVDNYDWTKPVVPVLKVNWRVRLCSDFKTTLNPNLIIDEHPLPSINHLFSSLAEVDKFAKLDLSQAYQELPVPESDQKYLTLNTHRGLYQSSRLMYGIAVRRRYGNMKLKISWKIYLV